MTYTLKKCRSSLLLGTIPIPAIILWTILFAIILPATADAQSWWQQLKQKGEQIGEQVIDETIDQFSQPAEDRQELPKQAPQVTDQKQDQQQAPAAGAKPSFSKAHVREAQRLLTELGYNPGPIDGIYGSATAKAIRAYQRDYNLLQTGEPTDQLLAHMTYTYEVRGTSKAVSKAGSGQAAPQASKQGGAIVLPAAGGTPVTGATGGNISASMESTSQRQAHAASPQPMGNASQSVAAIADNLGLDVIHGLPVVDGSTHYVMNNKKDVSAAKFIGLIELGLDTGALDSDTSRRMCLARTYLPVDKWKNYISTGAEVTHTPGAMTYNVGNLETDIINWKGTNEFERKRSAEAMLAAQGAELKSMAISLPIDVLVIRSVMLRNYDSKAGGFEFFHYSKGYKADETRFDNPLPEREAIPDGACVNSTSNENALYRDTFVDFPPSVLLPKIWAMDASRAEQIINRLIDRQIFVAYTIRLREIPKMKMDYMPLKLSKASARIPVWSELISADIYEDADLERLIERIPLKKPREPVLLTGIPESPRLPITATLDDTTLTLVMLREHGDVLSDAAWHDLMIDQAKQDDDYYNRRKYRHTGGGSIHREIADDFDQNYTPFFPNRFDGKRIIAFSEAQIALFKQWAKVRAMNLPNELIFKTKIENYPSVKLIFPTVKVEKYVTTDFNQALADKGYSTNQILLPDKSILSLNDRSDMGFMEGPARSRSPALILPNIVTQYIPSFSDEDLQQIFEGSEREIQLVDFFLKTGVSEFIPTKDGKEIFALHVTPTRLQTYNSDSTAVLFEHHYDVTAIDPNRLDVANPPVTSSGGEVLPLSAEVMDLLTVKYLPDYVSDSDYRQMMLARWEYEASIPPEKGEPDWGRFFIPGKPKPNASQQAELLSRFKSWTLKRSAALPGKVRLSTNPRLGGTFAGWIDEGKPLLIFTYATYHSGMDLRDIKGAINSCKIDARGYPALAPACDYLETVRVTTPSIYPFGLGYEKTGPRIQCNSAIGYGGGDTYCKARHAQFERVQHSDVEPGFRDIFVYDKETFFPGSGSEAEALRNPDMIVEVAVTGARVSDTPLPVPFIEALKRYDMFRESLGLNRVSERLHRSAETGAIHHFIFEADVISARLVKNKTLTSLRDLDLRPARTPDIDALTLKDTSSGAPDAPFGPDIVGVRLGMTFDEAEKAIRSHMDVGRVLRRDRENQSGAATGNFQKFSSARIFVSKDESEFIILYDEPPSALEVVVGITRQIHFDPGQVNETDVLVQMRGKYGKEDWAGKKGEIGWGKGLQFTNYNDSTSHTCMPAVGNIANREWAETDGSQTQWRPASGHAIPILMMYNNPSGRNCGPVLAMEFEGANGSRRAKDRLVLQLLDPNLYFKLYDESKRLVKSGDVMLDSAPQTKKISF